MTELQGAIGIAQLKKLDMIVARQRENKAKLSLPLETDGAQIVAMNGCEVFSAYVPGPRGPVFMTLIEKTFGTDVTTRTWGTIRKCVAAAE